jgi:hypothetical protein
MQTVFSEALLAQFRKKNNHNGARHEEPESDGASAGNDSDDVIDPDDSGPRLLVTLKESSLMEDSLLPAAQAEQITGPYPSTTDQSKAPQSPPKATAESGGIPAPLDLLDPAVLRTMPARVAAFMMYEPPDPPPWRYSETTGEQQWREDREADGSWCG